MVHEDGTTPSPFNCNPFMFSPRLREFMSPDQRGIGLINLLRRCVFEVSAGNIGQANECLSSISLLASPIAGGGEGHTMQRLASYFADALARRILIGRFAGVHRALLSSSDSGDRQLIATARDHFYEHFPFLKVAFLTSNQAILEAMEDEKVVHIIDLSGPAANPEQWLSLLYAFLRRPEGPPHLRITAVHDDNDLLHRMSTLLIAQADNFEMSFQFHAVEAGLGALDFDKLRVKTGEAVAVCSIFNLHRLLATDEAKGSPYNAYPMLGTFGDLLRSEHGYNLIGLSPDWAHSSSLPIESFLSSLYALSPKVVVVAEQEANHNGELCERFAEAIYYYANMFDCMESTAPRAVTERARVEKVLLGEEIKNIIACDGLERRERHEKLERWEQRLNLAGFGRVPLSYGGLEVARGLLESRGCEGYSVKDKNGCFFFCWKERPLFSISAWRFKRF